MKQRLGLRAAMLENAPMALALSVYAWTTFATFMRFPHNIDEGAYILAARRVLAGEAFMVDFFVHQIPLYEYTMAAILATFGDHWTVARGSSIVAMLLTAMIVYVLARRLWRPASATLAGIVFLTAPLAALGQWAMPNALSLLWEVAAVAVVFCFRSPKRLLLAGALFTAAAATKPLAAATATACVLYLLLVKRSWRFALYLVIAGLTWTTLMWIPLEWISQGGLTEIVLYEIRRVTVIGWRLVMDSPAYELMAQALNAETPADWNLAAHAAMLRGGFWLDGRLAPMAYILVLAAFGAVGLWRSGQRHAVALCALWIGCIFLFDVALWFPIFDHYFLQYLPPMALLASGIPYVVTGSHEPRRWVLVAAAAWALGAFALKVYPLLPPEAAYDRQAAAIMKEVDAYRQNILRNPSADIHLLTFDPFYNLIVDLPTACNLYDPLNQVGPMSFSGYQAPPSLARHNVSYEQVEHCIDTDERVFVVLSRQSAIVVRGELVEALSQLPVERKRRIGHIYPPELNAVIPSLTLAADD